MSDQHPIFTTTQLLAVYAAINHGDVAPAADEAREIIGHALAARGEKAYVDTYGAAR